MRLRIEGWIKKPTRQEIKQDNSCHYDVVEGVGQVLHTQVLVLISCSPTEASEWGSSDGGRYDRFDEIALSAQVRAPASLRLSLRNESQVTAGVQLSLQEGRLSDVRRS